MSENSDWLLEDRGHTTYPTRLYRLASGLNIEVPNSPESRNGYRPVALYLPGWTETELVSSRQSTAIRGMASASLIHPREGTINDFKNFLVSVPDIVRYYNLISGAIWDPDVSAEDAAHAIISDYTQGDNKLNKKFIGHALNAGERRKENVQRAISFLALEGYDVHIWGHSLGGIDASMATYDFLSTNNHDTNGLENEYVKLLGLLGSGGLLIDDSLTSIIPRIAKTVGNERREIISSPRKMAKMVFRSVLFIAENPALTFQEGHYAASGRLSGILRKMAVEYKLPMINVVAGNDAMFPATKVINDTRDTIFAAKVYIDEAGHNFTEHQSGVVGDIANNAAREMKNSSSSRLDLDLQNGIAKANK